MASLQNDCLLKKVLQHKLLSLQRAVAPHFPQLKDVQVKVKFESMPLLPSLSPSPSPLLFLWQIGVDILYQTFFILIGSTHKTFIFSSEISLLWSFKFYSYFFYKSHENMYRRHTTQAGFCFFSTELLARVMTTFVFAPTASIWHHHGASSTTLLLCGRQAQRAPGRPFGF